MTLKLYSKAYASAVQAYQLQNTKYTGAPADVLKRCVQDTARFPVMILENEALRGFFCLHHLADAEMYGIKSAETLLLRGFSIDERYQHQGVASRALAELFTWVDQEMSQPITRIILAVNQENTNAQKTYQKAGFSSLPDTFEGRLGTLILMEKWNSKK